MVKGSGHRSPMQCIKGEVKLKVRLYDSKKEESKSGVGGATSIRFSWESLQRPPLKLTPSGQVGYYK